MPKKVPQKTALPLYDQRMIEVVKFLISEKIQGIKSRTMALQAIGFPHNNYSQLTSGKQSFGPDHFKAAVERFGIDANFFFTKGHTKMMRDGKPKTAISELSEAVIRIKLELNNVSSNRVK